MATVSPPSFAAAASDALLTPAADRDLHALTHQRLRDTEAQSLRRRGHRRPPSRDSEVHAGDSRAGRGSVHWTLRPMRASTDQRCAGDAGKEGHPWGMRSPRAWFYDLLSRGEPPVVDEFEMIEVGYVKLTSGQIVLARLEQAGIRASSAQASVHPYDTPSMARIFCRRRDADEARRIIDDVTTL